MNRKFSIYGILNEEKHCKFSYNLQFQITLFILVSGQFYKRIIIATTIINIYVCVCVCMYVCMYIYIM